LVIDSSSDIQNGCYLRANLPEVSRLIEHLTHDVYLSFQISSPHAQPFITSGFHQVSAQVSLNRRRESVASRLDLTEYALYVPS